MRTALPDGDVVCRAHRLEPRAAGEFAKPYWAELQQFVAAERARTTVYPPHEDVFAALHLTPFADVKVVILGQDPYHGAGQAHGLCFSVREGMPAPPSLVNIFKELRDDLGIDPPGARLPRRLGAPGRAAPQRHAHRASAPGASHQGKGWETFTDEVLRAVNAKPERVVFILWGASARKKRGLVDTSRHVIIESAHPSPLSAHNGFFGSRPFSPRQRGAGGGRPRAGRLAPVARLGSRRHASGRAERGAGRVGRGGARRRRARSRRAAAAGGAHGHLRERPAPVPRADDDPGGAPRPRVRGHGRGGRRRRSPP